MTVFTLAAAGAAAVFSVNAQTLPREELTIETPRPPESAQPIVEAPPAETPPSASDVVFEISAVSVEGSTVYGPEVFEAIAAPYVGRAATLDDLRDLATAIETRYADEGYVATRVIVPPQRVTGGRVTLRVVEGFVARIVIDGDLGRNEALVRRYLASIEGVRPLTYATAERYLLLARDIPGVNLVASLRRSADGEPGAIELVVRATHDPFEGFGTVQNYASEAVGPLTVTLGGAANGLAGMGDRLQGAVLVAPVDAEQVLGQVFYETRFGSEGLTARGLVSYSNADFDGFGGFETDYEAWVGSAELEYPMIRGRDTSLWLRGGFDVTSQESDLGGLPLIDEDLLVAYAGARYVARGFRGGLLDATVELRQGLAGTQEGDPLLSRSDGDPQFTLIRGSAEYAQPLNETFSLNLAAAAQFSPDGLFSVEEFSLGNYTFGRGYDPGALSGDSGLAAGVELIAEAPSPAPDLLTRVQAFGFVEGGKIWDRQFPDDWLASAGAGLRAQVRQQAVGEVLFAVPLQDTTISGETPDPSVLFRLSVFF